MTIAAVVDTRRARMRKSARDVVLWRIMEVGKGTARSARAVRAICWEGQP